MVHDRSFLLPFILAFALLLPLVGCGGSDRDASKEESSLETAADGDDTLDVPVAEIDSIVGRYYSAADSLGKIFTSITTADDVGSHAAEIERLHAEINEFDKLTVRYGDIVLQRMSAISDDGAFDRLLSARERLKGLPTVYEAIKGVEEPITDVDEVDASTTSDTGTVATEGGE